MNNSVCQLHILYDFITFYHESSQSLGRCTKSMYLMYKNHIFIQNSVHSLDVFFEIFWIIQNFNQSLKVLMNRTAKKYSKESFYIKIKLVSDFFPISNITYTGRMGYFQVVWLFYYLLCIDIILFYI